MTFTDREYLSSGVNMLTNSVKISDTTKTEFSKLTFFQIHKKNGKTTAVKISDVFRTL